MTPQFEEAQRFLRLADRDRRAFVALLSASSVDQSIALFHAQQAVEKGLKAVLCIADIEYRRTHDLEELSARVVDAGYQAPADDSILRRLTPYAVEFRYDDSPPQLMTGDDAARVVDLVLAWAESIITRTSGG